MKLLLSLFLSLGLVASVLAAPQLTAHIVPGPGDGTVSLTIDIFDGESVVPGAEFNIPQCAAAESSGAHVKITVIKDNQSTVVQPTKVIARDFDQNGFTAAITYDLPASAAADAEFEVKLQPHGTTPAITFTINGQPTVIAGPITLKAGTLNELDLPYLTSKGVLRPSLEFGGGDDGSLLSLRFRNGGKLLDGHDYARWFLDIEADLSPGDASDSSLIYGRVKGEFDALWRVPFPHDSWVVGCAFFGVDAGFKSDQHFDNWDATVGLTSSWFVNLPPIDALGHLMHLSKDDGVLPHPLAFKLGADYVYASERTSGNADPEDIQISAHLIWLNRIYSGVTLPLMTASFDINFVVDVAAIWQPGVSEVHPETRLSLEFMPQAIDDAKLAFALTYAKGQFSPTFVDEDAFLAGLRWKF